jgi:hypothetical protein
MELEDYFTHNPMEPNPIDLMVGERRLSVAYWRTSNQERLFDDFQLPRGIARVVPGTGLRSLIGTGGTGD